MREAGEIRLKTRAGEAALLHWPAREDGAPRVLCLHGWLDNAASFIPLAQHLAALDLFALDFPGHGHSDHRHPAARYAFSEYLFDVDAVLDALGWQDTNLLAHSMGGGVACIYASAAPERVRSIVVADGLGPVSNDPGDTARQLKKSLAWMREERRPLRRFESIDAMAEAREQGFLDISRDAARLICGRAARKVGEDGGHQFVWRTDPALKWRSPMMFSEQQILDCLFHIEAPLLSFHAQPWSSAPGREWLKRRQAAVRHGAFRDVEGNHHFHMDKAEVIAPEIEAFITRGAGRHG